MSFARAAWRKLKASDNPAGQALVRVVSATRDLRRRFSESKHPIPLFFRSAQYRSTLMVRATSGGALHQTAARTRMDRYPEIFGACSEHFGRESPIRILSFGCSTGEEVVTLRTYFPGAEIVGAEINPRSLEICRARDTDSRITFVRSSTENIEAHAPYDAIFCMAVLQRDPHAIARQNVTSLRDVYPFDKFDRQISEFDRWLQVGGALVVHNAHYRLGDATVGPNYAPLPSAAHLEQAYAKFDRDSQLIGPEVMSHSIFIKGAAAS